MRDRSGDSAGGSRRLVGVLLIVAGCASPAASVNAPSPAALRPVPAAALPPLLDDGDPDALREAIARSEHWLAGQPADRVLEFGPRSVTAERLRSALGELRGFVATDPTPAALAEHIRAGWEVLESSAGDEVLVTGYYEPVIPGSRARSAEYPVPIYGPPADLVTASLEDWNPERQGERVTGRLEAGRLVPYPARAEITAGALDKRAPVLAWARDPVDLFFVEVQGSGTVRLAEGGELRIGYAASNGRPYRSIGRLLIDEGRVSEEAMSMQAIRAYLAAHPDEIPRVLNHNPSFVFFRVLAGAPQGSLGEPVTPGRSIATDARFFPPGALAFLHTTRPTPGGGSAQLTRFVLNQDTGGAIRGPGRVDFFWGRGADAAEAAGRMKQAGRLFFLLPKPDGR